MKCRAYGAETRNYRKLTEDNRQRKDEEGQLLGRPNRKRKVAVVDSEIASFGPYPGSTDNVAFSSTFMFKLVSGTH